MKNVTCQLCLKKGDFKFLNAKEMYLGTGKRFKYVLCDDCGSLSKDNAEDDLESFYKNYHSFKETLKNGFWKKTIKEVSIKSSFFRSLTKPFICRFPDGMKILSFAEISPKKEDKILDVGAGSGDFIQTLQELGYSQAIGIDPFIKQDTRYVLKASFFDMQGPFDIVTFHHALEHMENPVLVIKHLAKILKSNGKVIIRIPNVDSYSFRIFQENWQGIHPPFHLTLPSFKGMQALCKSNGFTIMKTAGEQILEFFLMSKEIQLNIPQHQNLSSLQFLLKKKKVSDLSYHSSQELKYWQNMVSYVKKQGLCDHIAYYLKKGIWS